MTPACSSCGVAAVVVVQSVPLELNLCEICAREALRAPGLSEASRVLIALALPAVNPVGRPSPGGVS